METTELVNLINTAKEVSSGLSFPGMMILVYFLWKDGIISFGKKNGNGHSNGNGYQGQIDSLKEQITEIKDNHLEHLRADVERVQDSVSEIGRDVAFIKGRMEK